MSQYPGTICVMVVDNSAVVRGLLVRMLDAEPGVKVVHSVQNGDAMLAKLRRTAVDVVILDFEMPDMGGSAVIPLIPLVLQASPETKIVMLSLYAESKADAMLEALKMGAVDYLLKPGSTMAFTQGYSFRQELVSKVKGWGEPVMRARTAMHGKAPFVGEEGMVRIRRSPIVMPDKQIVLRSAPILRPCAIAIGSSTGGPQALANVIGAIQHIEQPVFLTQHMPPAFISALAGHLSLLGKMPCVEAEEGMPIEKGKIYIAKGDFHMEVKQNGSDKVISLSEDQPENFCRPAVDPMLRSLAGIYGDRLFTVILTGMGADGLEGCREVVNRGGSVIAQDRETSVVWGMPGVVAQAGLCHAVLPIGEIGPYVGNVARKGLT